MPRVWTVWHGRACGVAKQAPARFDVPGIADDLLYTLLTLRHPSLNLRAWLSQNVLVRVCYQLDVYLIWI